MPLARCPWRGPRLRRCLGMVLDWGWWWMDGEMASGDGEQRLPDDVEGLAHGLYAPPALPDTIGWLYRSGRTPPGDSTVLVETL